MRGVTVRSPEMVDRARALRAGGCTYKQIGAALGINGQTAYDWLTDPDRVRINARRARYAGVCTDCGAATDGSRGPGHAADRCLECLTWTRQDLLDAVREFHATNGRSPRCDEMNGSRHAAPRLFGSWCNLLAAAGVPIKMDRRPETQAAIMARHQSGETYAQIAADYGCTPNNIYHRVALAKRKAQR